MPRGKKTTVDGTKTPTQEIKHFSQEDPTVPGIVTAEAAPGKTEPKIEVGTSYKDRVAPGVGADGMILNHWHYIDPEEGMDYKFCTMDGRRTHRNTAIGWEPVRAKGRTVDPNGKMIPLVGNMRLCQRPSEIGNQEDAQHEVNCRIQQGNYKAERIAEQNPGMIGRETITEL